MGIASTTIRNVLEKKVTTGFLMQGTFFFLWKGLRWLHFGLVTKVKSSAEVVLPGVSCSNLSQDNNGLNKCLSALGEKK